jgi:phosphate/sulfate permease
MLVAIKKFSLIKNIENMKLLYILAFCLSLLFNLILVNSIFFVDYISFSTTNFLNYFLKEHVYADFRTPTVTKNFLLLFLIIVTEFSLKFKSVNYRLDLFRFLRIFFLLTCLFLSFNSGFSEVSNRILYLYYIIEMGLLGILVSEKFYNTTTIILVAYAFAFNVQNIIGGI